MKYSLLLLLLLSSCAARIVFSYETEDATLGKSIIQKEQNEKTNSALAPANR